MRTTDTPVWLRCRHAAALNAQPALVAHERRLREKITILCLMELIFKCAPRLRRDKLMIKTCTATCKAHACRKGR